MAAGYSLSSGQYRAGQISDDEMWSAFAYLFSEKSINQSSYKYGFLKAILDNLYNTNDELQLTFDQLFSKFAEINWNLVLKHHIRQNSPKKGENRTQLERALWSAKEIYAIAEGIPFESLTDEIKLYVCKKVKQGCKGNVVGALYEDLQELFYSFDKKGEWIQFNPVMYEFVCKHKIAIEKLNYYEWARYLEKVNRDDVVDHLLTKIDESTKRESLNYYRDILFEEFENKCFYCGKTVTTRSVQVDHFVPWSFIKDDNLWNFVLACPSCNNKKRDKLAEEKFLSDLITRNNQIIIERHNEAQMKNYQAARLIKIYSWAKDNGYKDIWAPKE